MNANSSREQLGPGPNGPTTITWLQWYAGEQGWEVLDPVRRAFEADHPAIALEIQDVPPGQARDKIVTLNLADQAPDVNTGQITMTGLCSTAARTRPIADRTSVTAMWANGLQRRSAPDPVASEFLARAAGAPAGGQPGVRPRSG